MEWIVRERKQEPELLPFDVRIANAIEEAGINPANWTDEELDGWKEADGSWELRQAMKAERNRRAVEGMDDPWLGAADTMWTR